MQPEFTLVPRQAAGVAAGDGRYDVRSVTTLTNPHEKSALLAISSVLGIERGKLTMLRKKCSLFIEIWLMHSNAQ
jgi:hypothetical protein